MRNDATPSLQLPDQISVQVVLTAERHSAEEGYGPRRRIAETAENCRERTLTTKEKIVAFSAELSTGSFLLELPVGNSW